MTNRLNGMRVLAAGVVLACGVAVAVSAAPQQTEVAADYLIRPTAATAEALEGSTLSDWEYTLRTRPAKCRTGR